MSKCAKYDVLINMAVDGELGEDEKSELDAHLAVCSECRAYLKVLQSMRKAAGETCVQPPEELAEGIMYKVRLEAYRKHGRFLPSAATRQLQPFFAWCFFPYTSLCPCLAGPI
jgi:anti-sigma factor RsiW